MCYYGVNQHDVDVRGSVGDSSMVISSTTKDLRYNAGNDLDQNGLSPMPLPVIGPPQLTVSEPPQDSPVVLTATSVFVKDEKERPRRCFLCVGAALALEPDHPLVEDLIHQFYILSDLSKHFRRKYPKVLVADAK
ncbi:hypothetical protein NKR23_g2127 [Pleurostoma richardsiae]|uniref:Uncharacterized protein n=1 Tax=Pleurostoma richardsiae TaxID=41990 RepID=A0AA38VYK9_9PEZI|nr:hypothetical protein NKR23_g2127 [Pleurostoma richardsiae]